MAGPKLSYNYTPLAEEGIGADGDSDVDDTSAGSASTTAAGAAPPAASDTAGAAAGQPAGAAPAVADAPPFANKKLTPAAAMAARRARQNTGENGWVVCSWHLENITDPETLARRLNPQPVT